MRRPSSLAVAAFLLSGSVLAAGRNVDSADFGPSDDLVKTACSQGLLVKPDDSGDDKSDPGAGLQGEFPGLFGGGSDAPKDDKKKDDANADGASTKPAPRAKTRLLRPKKDDKDCAKDMGRFYSKYGGQVNAIPAPEKLDAAQIQANADQLYAKLTAGPVPASRLSALTGSDLAQRSAAVNSLFDGSRPVGAVFAQMDADAQARATAKAAGVLSAGPNQAADGVPVGAAPAEAKDAVAAAPGAGVLTDTQRKRFKTGGVPDAAAPASASPSYFSQAMDYARNAYNAASDGVSRGAYAAVGSVSAAVNSAAHAIVGTGDPAITTKMDDDVGAPPAWTMKRSGRYGTADFVAGLKAVCKTAQTAGLATPIGIGDISKMYGGPIGGHKSHRVGKDADVYFIGKTESDGRFDDPLPNLRLAGIAVGIYGKINGLPVTHIFVDSSLIERMKAVKDQVPADERAQVDAALGVMSHWPGHKNHFHIRAGYYVHPGDMGGGRQRPSGGDDEVQ
jgi:hypothetical protein